MRIITLTLLFITQFVKSQISAIVSGVVTDKYNYKLAGVQLVGQIDGETICQCYSQYDGSFTMSGKMKSKSLTMVIMATLSDNTYGQTFQVTGVEKNNEIEFSSNTHLSLQAEDMTQSASLQRCEVQFSIVDVNDQPVSIDVTVVTSFSGDINNKPTTFTTPIEINQKANALAYLLLPQANIYVGSYKATANGYWPNDKIDERLNPQGFFFSAQNYNKVKLVIVMVKGQIKQITKGSVVSSEGKPVAGAVVSMVAENMVTQETQAVKGTASTASDGSFSLEADVGVFKEFAYTLSVADKDYLPLEYKYTQEYDVDDSSKDTYTKDVGKLTLKSKAPSKYSVVLTGTVTDATKILKAVPNAAVSVVLTPQDKLATTLAATSDANGLYRIAFDVPPKTAYTMVVHATLADFKDYASPAIPVKPDANQDFKQDIAMDRVTIQANVHETIEDTSQKPILGADITLQSSDPLLSLQKDYNQKTKDDSKYPIYYSSRIQRAVHLPL